MKKSMLTRMKMAGVALLLFASTGFSFGVNVTLRVDMSLQAVSPNGVHVAGSFQGFNPATTALTNTSGNVWSVTLTLAAGDPHAYRFVNGNSAAGYEVVPAACASGLYRSFTVPANDTVLPVVCFSECGPCQLPTVPVTFQVDMSQQTVSPNGVHLAGNFQGWNTAGTPMLPAGNGKYAVTVNIEQGAYIEYKFVNGDAWGGEEWVPSACGVPSGTGSFNRYDTIGTAGETLPVVCFGSCTVCQGSLQYVTFQVDMSQQTVSPNGVHVAGDFQGWNPGTTELTTTGNGIYTATVSLVGGNHYVYKFINGNDWSGEEIVPSECGEPNGYGGYNRYITVPAADTTTTAVCFGSCTACTQVTTPVTFKVDMSQDTVSPDGVHVAGSFQGWDPGATALTLTGNGIYEVTLNLYPGTYEYKFINGNAWGGDESVPAGCSQNGNRYVTVGTAPLTLLPVCFGSCNPCLTINAQVTFQVDMTYQTVSPDGVHVAGSFQGWDPGATALTDIGNNVYAVTLSMPPGNYEFKFINGNAWGGDESVPSGCAQNGNRFVDVVTSVMLPPVCFASCDLCLANVTLQVDMSNQTVSPDGVHVAGSFQGWDPAATALIPVGNGIYAVTLSLAAGSYEYKFINGNAWGGDESVPSACGQNGNRLLNVVPGDTTLPAFCFGSCYVCSTPSVNVTFQVDMTYQTVSPDGVHVAGSFQGWNPGTTAMALVGNGIYAVTMPLHPGDYYEYKFVNGNSWGGAEEIPSACNFNGNRAVTASSAMTLPAVCFSSCEACPAPSGTVSGKVTYLNPNNTPLGSVSVILKDAGGNVVYTTVTDVTGNYFFQSVPFGSYTLELASTAPWGGGNSADALFIMKDFVGMTPLTGLYKIVADVTGTFGVNAQDALMVARRFVGQITGFPVQDWFFETPSVDVVDTNPILLNVKGLCAGDVNGSYIP